MSKIILGIDPGTINCGYCLLEKSLNNIKIIEAGLIRIKSKVLQEQILEMTDGLDLIFNNNKIDEVSLEDIFYAYNPKSFIKLAQFRGALMLSILQKCVKCYEYTPLQVKKSLTGNGKSSKEQVSFMVKKLLGIKKDIKPFDVTDAIAIAITHSQRLIK